MSITALEIQEVRFGEVKKGYDPNEVDEFLERVATDVDTLNRALSEAASRIKAAEKRAAEAEQRLIEVTSAPSAASGAAAEGADGEKRAAEADASGEVIAKAFIAAQKSADALQEEARKEAELIYREAESKGRDIIRDALSEKQKALDELNRLRESCEKFRTEYINLIKYFQTDAQKRLTTFDNVLNSQSVSESVSASSSFTANNDAAFKPTEASKLSSNTAPDPFATTAYRASLDDEDDLDIEEID